MDKYDVQIFIFMTGIILVGLLGAYLFDKAACHAKTVGFESSRYTILSGCMVKHKGKWLPLDNIRGFDDK